MTDDVLLRFPAWLLVPHLGVEEPVAEVQRQGASDHPGQAVEKDEAEDDGADNGTDDDELVLHLVVRERLAVAAAQPEVDKPDDGDDDNTGDKSANQ